MPFTVVVDGSTSTVQTVQLVSGKKPTTLMFARVPHYILFGPVLLLKRHVVVRLLAKVDFCSAILRLKLLRRDLCWLADLCELGRQICWLEANFFLLFGVESPLLLTNIGLVGIDAKPIGFPFESKKLVLVKVHYQLGEDVFLEEKLDWVRLHVHHRLKHTLPVLDWLNFRVVIQDPVGLAALNAHVVRARENGHTHELVLHLVR